MSKYLFIAVGIFQVVVAFLAVAGVLRVSSGHILNYFFTNIAGSLLGNDLMTTWTSYEAINTGFGVLNIASGARLLKNAQNFSVVRSILTAVLILSFLFTILTLVSTLFYK